MGLVRAEIELRPRPGRTRGSVRAANPFAEVAA